MAKQMRQILELFQDNSNLTYMLYSATISFQVEELGEFCPPVLIFVQSKERGHELLAEMQDMCLNTVIKVDFIHQDLTQQERQNIINGFRLGKLYVLICTDLMARGIDFKV
ncbi:P-loop containing nucleoside triphosphate hydrolase [Pseudocohnilembus persalinus]|uniref:p-loop containing nucleoside triphosphate hydrolase n=1 Tax=Pseudocohnilembus persalinus TaxID=266149 RepID=A0A0V0QPE1_PSEPJ|nr:P-loop containing nucleoside triphosphate hydrolase [Pseudocohnilembus persalinus]|eukprot:KRX04102.1 P-loop containing nucleoside triphosphate hydrolase [Pseudocohnilembus persalinus]